MLSKQDMSKRAQIGFFSLEDLVPKDHLLRQVDQCVKGHNKMLVLGH